METAESLVYRQIRRILTIMTPGETGGMEIEINLSPEGVQLIFKNKKNGSFQSRFFKSNLSQNYFAKSNRSKFITLFQAATKSFTNRAFPSSLAYTSA